MENTAQGENGSTSSTPPVPANPITEPVAPVVVSSPVSAMSASPKKSFVLPLILFFVAIAVVLSLAAVLYKTAKYPSKSTTAYNNIAPSVIKRTSITPSPTPATVTAQIDTIDTSMSSLSADLNAVNQGLNDQSDTLQ